MPTSRSLRPPTEPVRSRLLRPLIGLAVLAVLIVAVAAAPASWAKRFLPPAIQAEDFSGSLWHGSVGHIRLNSRDAGALEWHLHPASLLWLTIAVDLHWVKIGFVADASARLDRHQIQLTQVKGGGPLEDLADLGVLGINGSSHFEFRALTLGLPEAQYANTLEVLSAVGDLNVSDLETPQIANGTNLGSYTLHFADGAITPDVEATAELTDTGGPLSVQAALHFSAKDRRGLLSGTVKERPDASPALRSELQNLTQLHARDDQGRIPVEFEFTL